ncbi:MAG TPA: DNA polymerase III subunit beta [Clostridiales bacterium]|nr:DNA polymerase III subunit beta [Clostridiales bacterium]
MKFKVAQEDLAQSLQLVQRAVSPRSPLPVLQGILIETTSDGLALSATDQEIGIRVLCPATVAEEGALVLPSRLGDIVRKIPFGEISFEADAAGNTMDITWERSRFTINGFPAQEFPPLPEPAQAPAYTIAKSELRRMVRQTAFAVSHDDSRPVFTGVLFVFEGERVKFVATDGFRLAVSEGDLVDRQGDIEGEVIVPGRGVSEVSRVLGEEGDGQVKVSVSGNRVFFEGARERVVCRLIEGQFPPFNQVIPKQFVTKLTCRTRDLLDACERASLIARDVGQAVKLEINGSTLVLSASAPELGTVREEVAIESQGDTLEIAFNPRYLIEGLRNIDSEKMTYEFTGPLSPSCMRPADPEEADSFICVVLPMRLA